MPDYNPAVALGVNASGPNLTQGLGTIAQFNSANAMAGLRDIQALQQQRQYNALQAAAQAYQGQKDPTAAYLSAGGDPAGANQLQTVFANQRAMAQTPGGVLPQAYEQLTGANKNLVEAGKAGAETTTTNIGNAAKIAAPVISSGGQDDGAWRDAVLAHYKATGGGNPLEMSQVLGVSDPAKRVQIAQQYSSSGMSPDELNKPTQYTPGNAVTTPGRLMTPPTTATLGGQPGNAPAIPGLTPQEKEQQQNQGKYFSNLYSGISAQGNTAANALDDIHIAKSVISDPGFYSGTAENVVLGYKRALASLGVDPGKSEPQEVFRKVMAQNILQQVNGLRAAQEEMGTAGGRIFQSQIGLMEKAAQNPDNSKAANMFLTTLADRSAQRSMQIADMAGNYNGGKLDPAFEKQFRSYISDHPLFGDWELSHKNLIGEPQNVVAAAIPAGAKQTLAQHPETAVTFNKHFGPDMAQYILGSQGQ